VSIAGRRQTKVVRSAFNQVVPGSIPGRPSDKTSCSVPNTFGRGRVTTVYESPCAIR